MWASEKQDLTNQRNNAIDRRGSLESSMDNYRTIIAESEQAVIDHDGEAGRFTSLLDQQQRVCDEEQTSYDNSTAKRYLLLLYFTDPLNRDNDLDILRRLKEYMEQNI